MRPYIIVTILLLIHISSNGYAYDVTASPSFWIDRLDNHDAVLMDADKIYKFNDSTITSIDQMAKIEEMYRTISGSKIKQYLTHDPLPVDKKRFDKNGRKIGQRFFRELEENINLEGAEDITEIRFGVITNTADIRAFPTIEPIREYPNSKDFDTIQYSKIYPPSIVALLHVSKDKKWGFFQASFVRGWIRLNDVAFAKDRDEILPDNNQFLIITGSFVDVYEDRELKKILERLPMGTRLSITGEDEKRWIVAFPYKTKDSKLLIRGSAYISKTSDVNKGFLPYTKKNIIQQAFKTLGEGYGWGNIHGKRDCSSFIKDVFATVGIYLPRNSRQQISTGKLLGHTDNGSSANDLKEAVKSAVPGITLIGLNGHIMLYLGKFDNRDYVIHSLFGYGDADGFKAVNSTVVTDLNLGSRTKSGAFINRLKGITLVTNEPQTKDSPQ
ncbi:MAG: SH3 domain-containing protein [Deltaproteobacteria bacterium]|nr:SH3 domain-containing protein [Deltaproteobacteria bacterium]